MQVYMVFSEDDYINIIGYYANGVFFEDLSHIERPTNWLGKREGISISTDMAYIEGKGMVNIASIREKELAKLRMRVEIELGLEMDSFTRSLLGYRDERP